MGTITAPNQTLNTRFSPRAEPYPAFRVHLDEISRWLHAGHSVRGVWMEWKERGAFPGCYRTFLRYCRKHNLPCSGSIAPETPGRDRKHSDEEDRNPLASRPRLVATHGVQVPQVLSPPEDRNSARPKVSTSANSARPSKIYALPFCRPPEFIPSEED
jgi:hypothetical protein